MLSEASAAERQARWVRVTAGVKLVALAVVLAAGLAGTVIGAAGGLWWWLGPQA